MDSSATRDTRWSGQTRGGRLGNWIFIALARYVGLRLAYLVLIPVALYYVFFAPKAARASAAYLRNVGLGSSWLKRLWNMYRHFYVFGQVLIDRAAIIGGDATRCQFTRSGAEQLEAALNEGRGVIVLSAHYGGWEMAAHVLQRLKVRVNVVAAAAEAPHVKKFFDRAFAAKSFGVIELDGSINSSFEITAALARGEIVAMHGDRALNWPTGRVPFLGKLARFPQGPHMLAAATGVPMVHTFITRQKAYHYHFRAYPPEQLAATSRHERLRAVDGSIRRYVEHLEEIVRHDPLQWFNFFEFWEPETETGRA